MRYCLIDFETASGCNLKKAGAWRYAEDPSTEIICLGYAIDGKDPVVRAVEHMQFGNFGAGNGHAYQLEQAVQDPTVIFVAFNVTFEKAIWRNIMMPVYGWPDIPDERWHDIQATCAMKALPIKLDKVLRILNLPLKDTEGTHVTLSLSRANKQGNYVSSPAILQRVYDYNRTDLTTEAGLHRRVRGLGASERQVWLLDQRINERGVRLDRELIAQSDKIVASASVPLAREFKLLCGLKPTQREKVLDWLNKNGCAIPDLKKDTVAKWLKKEPEDAEDSLAGDEEDFQPEPEQLFLPIPTRRALEIRSVLGSASIKKLASMRACIGADGRVRGLLQYHGAGTGRWAGRLLQPQNFPRPNIYIDGVAPDAQSLVDALLTGDAERVRAQFGEPVNVVASSLRHILIPGEGNLFAVGDFSKIEAVVVLALAGAPDTARGVLERGSAVYTDTASRIFGRPITKHQLFEYTIGKNSILGCGFQMGWKTFRRRYWNDGTEEQLRAVVDYYRKDFAPEVPKLWYGLEAAATATVWTGAPHEAYGIVYALEDGWLTARLPSGRKLWYRSPRKARKAMPWDPLDIRPGWTYEREFMGHWVTRSAYGGLLTENVVQAIARDLLVHAMFNCEREAYPVVLTVHDEIVAEVEARRADAKMLEQLMTDGPQWAKNIGIPIGAECWTGDRYRK